MPRTDDAYRRGIGAIRPRGAYLRMQPVQLHREGRHRTTIKLDEHSPLVFNLRRNNCFWPLGHYLLHRNGGAYRLPVYGHSACCNRLDQSLRRNLRSHACAECCKEMNLGNLFEA
jgi:hypothetical protein